MSIDTNVDNSLESLPSEEQLEDMLTPAPSGISDFGKLGLLAAGVLVLGLLGSSPKQKRTFVPGRAENVVSLGKALRQRRNDLKLTQEQLAERSGVGVRFISEVEHGKPRAEIGKVFLLLDALDLKIDVSIRK